jgi:hypothetical protein
MSREGNPFGSGGDHDWSVPLWVQVTIGVTFGVLAANFIEFVVARQYVAWEVSEAGARLRSEMSRVSEAAAVAESERRRAEALRTRQAADREHADEVLRASAAAAAMRREDAWKRFYRPSAGCAGSVATVECGNEHARFLREFEVRFPDGRF